MRYLGSKSAIAHDVMFFLKLLCEKEMPYVEPFVGASNSMVHTTFVTGCRIGSDSNKYLIGLYKALLNGYAPPDHISLDLYNSVKNNKDAYPVELVGFIGFGCSFGGKWFGGYARGGFNKGGLPRNYACESARALLKQRPFLLGVDYVCTDYKSLLVPDKSLIYCDPPYANTTKYASEFDSPAFWEWCRRMVHAGHRLLVSEYDAPADFRAVWCKDVHCSVAREATTSTGKKTEKLFVLDRSPESDVLELLM